MKPTDIRDVAGSELLITWDDGHRSLYSLRALRGNCACAYCVDERSGQRVFSEAHVAEGIRVVEWSPVGLYGIRFVWSDGHQTGIYGFPMLRALCPCGVCASGQVSGR